MRRLSMADRSITFGKYAENGAYKFFLEPEENNGTTVFPAGFTARLKLYPGGQSPSLSVTRGTVKTYASGLRQQITEFIIFKNSRKASATFPVALALTAEWQGEDGGNPVFTDSNIYLPQAATSVLKLVYETVYDLVDVTCPDSVFCLVSAEKAGQSGIFALDFTDDLTTGTYTRTVILTVRDACTKKTLKDAHIYVNGKYMGKSDSEGRVRLGSMKTGTYSLLVEKSGYKRTDEDNVNNDIFTVS